MTKNDNPAPTGFAKIVADQKNKLVVVKCLTGEHLWNAICGFCKGYSDQRPVDTCPGCNGMPF